MITDEQPENITPLLRLSVAGGGIKIVWAQQLDKLNTEITHGAQTWLRIEVHTYDGE